MSMWEKTSWIAVVTTLVIWSYYFGAFWGDALAGRIDGEGVRNLFIICMVVSVVIMLGLNIAAAVSARPPPRPPAMACRSHAAPTDGERRPAAAKRPD